MSKYGYLEVFQRVPLTSRKRESTIVAYHDSELIHLSSKRFNKRSRSFLTGNIKLCSVLCIDG